MDSREKKEGHQGFLVKIDEVRPPDDGESMKSAERDDAEDPGPSNSSAIQKEGNRGGGEKEALEQEQHPRVVVDGVAGGDKVEDEGGVLLKKRSRVSWRCGRPRREDAARNLVEEPEVGRRRSDRRRGGPGREGVRTRGKGEGDPQLSGALREPPPVLPSQPIASPTRPSPRWRTPCQTFTKTRVTPR